MDKHILFHFQKIFKWIRILLKTDRELQEISFDYYKNWHFKNAYLVIQFQFKNAIWVEINGSKRIYKGVPVILNLNKIDKAFLDVKICGLLSKKLYKINIRKENYVHSNSLKSEINYKKNVFLKRQIIKKYIQRTRQPSKTPTLQLRQIETSNKNLELNYAKFKLQDYL